MNILDIAIAKKLAGGGGGSGTDNYNDLSNLPKINDTTLSGNKSSSALGLQSEINSDSKLASDLVDDTNQDNKFVTSTEKNTWNGKQNAIDADHKINADYVDDSTSTNKFVTASDKETWNAKQNAIDSDHKLSSSLVNFSNAEAAALASGIDSNDVQQIGVNQTNILYSLQTGADNLCPESKLTIVGNSHTKSLTVNLPAGKYYISCNATLTGSILADGVFKNSAGTAIGTASGFANGANAKSITIADTATEFYFYSTDANATFDQIMIVPEIVWNAMDHNFRPAAISNADLTKLEAEDRTALIECVDESAKNLLDLANVTDIDNNVTVSKSNSGFTITSTDQYAFHAFILTLQAGVYHLSADISALSGSNTCSVYIRRDNVSGDYIGYQRVMANGKIAIRFTVDQTRTIAISFYASDRTYVDTTTYTVSNLMISTKAKYDISSNYEPHALPNSDLTYLEAEDRAALAEVVDSGAKNLADFINGGTVYNATKTVSGNAVTITTTGTHGRIFELINVTKSGNFTIACTISNLSVISGSVRIIVSSDINANSIISNTQITSNGKVEINFNTSLTAFYVHIFSTYENYSDANTLTISDFLICTKAAFDISPAFVPYCDTNSDLTQEANTLHERTDQIQPVVSFATDEPGWYRVFTLGSVPASVVAVGAYDNSCDIVIKRIFANTNNEHHEIKLVSIFQNMEFTDEYSKSAVSLITNIRYVSTNDTAYIDIYYSGSAVNSMTCFINNNAGESLWKAVNTVVKVPETTTGETVWASHNFSANDYKKAPGLNSVAMESGSLNDLSTSFIVCALTVTDKPLDAWGFVRTTVFDSNTALQEFFAYSSTNQSDNGVSFVRVKQGGTWKSWKQITNA